MGRTHSKTWRAAEWLAWAGGTAGLLTWSSAGAAGAIGARDAIEQVTRVDQRLWSPERVRAWHDTMRDQGPPALAVLRIPRIGIEAPVLDGTDDWTLNRGVGLIEDTVKPGTNGNSGIAGHRDGFFRALKDIQVGDVLELETSERITTYRVDRTWVVEPDDVSVLDATPVPSVTLVTCYPFYFVGPAPQRLIVRATRTGDRSVRP
jgi:sortase A